MNYPTPFHWDSFNTFPIVGILRGFPTELVKEIGKTCFDAGLTNLEVTLNSEHALEQIEALRTIAPDHVNVGAGTVTSLTGLNAALEAGANFIVSPITDRSLIEKCVALGIPCMPGAYTPTEVFQAWDAGAPIVKLFPSNIGGPSYAATVLAPLDQIKLLAVGSVNLDNFTNYLEAGVVGAGLGTPLFDKNRMHNKEWHWLTQQIQAFKQLFEAFNRR